MLRLPCLLASLTLLLCVESAPANAAERVVFETPPVPPSAFKVKRARAQGKAAEPTPGIRLSGIVSKPDGGGPFPAIVILPEGDGQQAANLAWADYLAEQGFVTLFIESFAARGVTGFGDSPALDMVTDAQSGRRFLSGLDHVDGDRIGLLGFGRAGWFVQRALDAALRDRQADASFGAGVALYPHCDPETRLVAPVLILAGEEDTLMSLATCRSMVELNRASDLAAELHVYAGASHSFDNVNYSDDPAIRGAAWQQPVHFDQGRYDPQAHADARQRVVEFFRRTLR